MPPVYAKKRSSRKLIVLVMLLALIVGGAVGGTFAWLITRTDPIVNTFTEGNIDIYLAEHQLDPQTGAHATPEAWIDTVNGNVTQSAELLPGRTIYKDPTVVVEAGSEPCYVRMFMIVDYDKYMDSAYEGVDAIKDWFAYDSNWTCVGIWEDKKYGDYGHVFEFRYNDLVTAGEEDPEYLTLFHSITIPDDLKKDEDPYQDMYSCLSEAKLTFVAQAVQARKNMQPFEDVAYPDVTLSMTNGTMTLEALINRNLSHLTPEP